MEDATIAPVQYEVIVPLPSDRAFEVFVHEFTTWWPHEYTWAGDVLDTIVIEAKEGGRCYERGPHGFTVDWGRVVVCECPARLVFTWQISPDRQLVPDPAKASEVEVRFEVEGVAMTRVRLEHRGFERHGERAAAYRDALAAPEGWPYILDRFAAAAAKQVSGVV